MMRLTVKELALILFVSQTHKLLINTARCFGGVLHAMPGYKLLL